MPDATRPARSVTKKTAIASGLLALAGAGAAAQGLSPVAQSVRQAVEGNPGVAAKFDAFRASGDEIVVARGAWRPHLDVSANAGRRAYELSQGSPRAPDFAQGGVRAELSQLLWDGLATRHELDRLGHARMRRYFEFLDSTEQSGMEAARAYYDVVRYRRLVQLAEDNYVQHKYSLDQVQSRVQAGVGRGVDLEQVRARVALAQSNLVNERANLHDAAERYVRIVGALPPADDVSAVSMLAPLPATEADAMREAALHSPAVAGAIESLRAARAAVAGRQGAFQPRVEARVRAAAGHNLDGQLDERRDAGAEIALTWNVFNGGADSARERQYAHLLDQAEDERDEACREVRQAAAIAFDDVARLREQLGYLDRNVVSIQKAHDAYRQQFDIGQRSLIDLLNAENELYTARRSYVLAEADLAIAVVRTYAAMGTLVANLGLRRPGARDLAPEAQGWDAGGDASSRCPLEPVDVGGASFAQLDARADQLAAARGLAAASAAAASASAPASPSAPASRPAGTVAPGPSAPAAHEAPGRRRVGGSSRMPGDGER